MIIFETVPEGYCSVILVHRDSSQKVLICIARILLVLSSVTVTLDGKSSTRQWDLSLGPRLVKTLMNARLGVQI